MHSTRELNYSALALHHSLLLLVNEMITLVSSRMGISCNCKACPVPIRGSLTPRSSLSYNPNPAMNTPLIPVARAAFVLSLGIDDTVAVAIITEPVVPTVCDVVPNPDVDADADPLFPPGNAVASAGSGVIALAL
jgi:hypothetical protein